MTLSRIKMGLKGVKTYRGMVKIHYFPWRSAEMGVGGLYCQQNAYTLAIALAHLADFYWSV